MRHVEALAMLGLVVDVVDEKCERPRFRRIIVKLYNGRVVSSICYFDEEVEQSVKIIRVYIDLAKKNNAIGKLEIVEESKPEE